MGPTSAPALAILILLAYVASLWWLLRDERARTLIGLATLTLICLALRLVYTGDYPAGLNEDEVKILWCTIGYHRQGALWVQDCTGLPALLSILFEAQLAEIIGPNRWAIRSYSMLGSVLAVPAGFAAARSLGLRVAPSLAAAGFLAVLPWSILYGRVHQSGEMVFHELLVVAALARFIRGSGGLPEIGMAALGLCLLFYGYFSGRALLGLTLVAAVLARGRYRAFCLAVPIVALIGWMPYVMWSNSPHLFVGLSSRQTQEQYVERPLWTLQRKTTQALEALVWPVANDQWLTIRTGAMHPLLVLGLAVVGSLTGVRRGLFLWAGFLGGLAPAILGYSPYPSTRRMLMAFPFISLAAACAFDVLPRPWLRRGASAAVVLVVGVQSVLLYFSDDFWPEGSRAVFDAGRTALVEALPMPPHPRLIVSWKLGYYFAPRTHYDRDFEKLSAENWLPADGEDVIYALDPTFAPLLPLYQSVFGGERVESFGSPFLVRLEAGDWSRARAHGWRYEASCEGAPPHVGQVPALFQAGLSFEALSCAVPRLHVWSASWNGPATTLRLRFTGKAEIETGRGVLRAEGYQAQADFGVAPGDDVAVRLQVPYGLELLATLVELSEGGERVPLFEWATPSAPEAGPAP